MSPGVFCNFVVSFTNRIKIPTLITRTYRVVLVINPNIEFLNSKRIALFKTLYILLLNFGFSDFVLRISNLKVKRSV
jgi:hypothetical protein